MAKKQSAEESKVEGMRLVESNAGTNWNDLADKYLSKYLAEVGPWKDTFLVEEFRGWAERAGLPAPHNAKAFGPVIKRAEKRGWVRSAGYGAAASSNNSPKVLWQAAG